MVTVCEALLRCIGKLVGPPPPSPPPCPYWKLLLLVLHVQAQLTQGHPGAADDFARSMVSSGNARASRQRVCALQLVARVCCRRHFNHVFRT